MNRKTLPLLLFLLALLLIPSPARADGIIIPEPPIVCDTCPEPFPIAQLNIRFHRVDVTIEDQIAVTRVDQVFHNPNSYTVEGTYIFPLPKDAAVTDFKLWIDGQPVDGQVLSAEEARRKYEEIVRKMIDPALLEYADQGAVQARIFPIDPDGERRIELEYTQALVAENGLVRYSYPLNTEKFSRTPLENVAINLDVSASVPLRAMYSPTHDIAVSRESETHFRAGYEASDVLPDKDFVLYYSLGETEAFHLLSYRDPTDLVDPQGFFLLLLAPRPDAELEALPKDVLLVLDRSGSMEGEKYLQAQDALRFILEHLNPEDRFNVITFSTDVETYASRLVPASGAQDAIDWVQRSSPLGSTDINRALLEAAALADRERPTYVIFLTDGLPTEGEVDSQRILDNLESAAPSNLRLFSFGVGFDVDTFLLDLLADSHHGDSTYVVPGERIDETVSAFYAKVSTPVLTDLNLDFEGVRVFDTYPEPLPDLFVGSQIVVVGRYSQGGVGDALLTGVVNGRTETFRFPEQVFVSGDGAARGSEAIPRLWATRKIGHLLNQIRLHGPNQETIDQIVRLSIRYGIVTPYTSYLVTEPMALGAEEQDRIARQQFEAMEEAPAPSFSGQEAVEKAADQGDLAEAEVAAEAPAGAKDLVRVVGSRTFVRTDGVWVDTAFDPNEMDPVQVPFLSDDYFSLVAAYPELGAAFALGPRVIAFADGVAYQVTDSGATAEPVQIPPTRTPETLVREVTPVPGNQGTPVALEPEPNENERPPGVVPCLGGFLPLVVFLFPLWRAAGRGSQKDPH